MCGIFGIWHFDAQPIDLAQVQLATNMLRHRGPDDEGYLLVNTQTGRTVSCAGRDTDARLSLRRIESHSREAFDLALGFRRLAILDLSAAAHQPMSSPDRRLWIVFNGEIYNYIELRDELSDKGYKFRSDSDTEVLVAAYQEWGYDCLSRFNGMWAFVLWDAMNRRLFIARDRLGIKPLYYGTPADHTITLASEIKALVGSQGIPFQPNEEAVYRYLVAGSLPSPTDGATFHHGVQALPAGHWMTVRDGDVKTHQYWTLDTASSKESQLSALHSVEEYRRLFTDSVRLRLRADVPVGSCLSGGVDSSSIVCVANELLTREAADRDRIGNQQKTFSAVYDIVGPWNETEYIESVLKATGAEGHFGFPTLERLRQDVERLVWHQEEPFTSTSIFAQWCVMDEARNSPVKVLLDGQGADELLAGYRPYSVFLSQLMRQGRIRDALAEARAIQARTGIPAWSPLAGALRYLLPHQILRALRRRWYTWQQDWSVLNRDFAARMHHTTVADWWPWPDHRTLETHLGNLLQQSSLPHLLRYEDRNSMAFGIEARVPYLDYRLVDFCFSHLPPWQIRDGWTKWVLRNSMQGLVPNEVVWRTDKVGFETPEALWLLTWMREQPDFFAADSLAGEYLDCATIRSKLARWTKEGCRVRNLPLWRWLNLELWLRLFLNQASFGGNPRG